MYVSLSRYLCYIENMDIRRQTSLSSDKNEKFSTFIGGRHHFFAWVEKYKLPIFFIIGIMLITSFVYLITFSGKTPGKINSRESGQSNEKNNIDGNSLKVGDYIEFGSYEVEKEGSDPLLWVVIDNNDHYAGNVNPDMGHLTLLTADVIDLRGFDALEPENANDIRRGYGNSRYKTSNIRQWLNSDKNAHQWWQPQNLDDENNNTDTPPSDAGFPLYNNLGYDDKDGFLKGFSEEEKQAILETNITVGKNLVTEGGGQEIVTDKVFLLSLTETGFEGIGGTVEGEPLNIFKNDSIRQATVSKKCAENSKSSDKPSPDKKWSWWLRSPSAGFPASVYVVSDIGSVLYSPANMPEGSVGLRPALNIKNDYVFSGIGTRENPYRILSKSDDLSTGYSETEKKDKAAENDKATEVVGKNKDTLSEGDITLQNMCQKVIADYPDRDKTLRSIVAWEDSDETFYIRSSPDSSTWKADNPAGDGYKLIDIGFIDHNTLGFTLFNTNKKYKIGIMDISFENSGTVFKGNTSYIQYENVGEVLDVSYIDKEDFVILLKEGKNVSLKHNEALLYQTEYIDSDSYKLGKSPHGAHVYMIVGNDLLIFDISKNVKIGEIKNIVSAVWIGNFNILYSGENKSYIYSLKEKTSKSIDAIKPGILGFCPENGGVIISNKNLEARAISCKSFAELNSASNTFFEALADSDTAIFTQYKSDNSEEETGYWRFISAGWGLHLSYGMYYHNNKPVFATLWSNY